MTMLPDYRVVVFFFDFMSFELKLVSRPELMDLCFFFLSFKDV